MALSRVRKDCSGQDKYDEAFLPKGGMNVVGQRKSVFGKYADSDMLSWIRGLALDPCRDGLSWDSIRPFWNQTLKVRKALSMDDAEFPRRKRKLQQFLKDKFRVSNGLTSEVPSEQNVTKLSRGQLSHASSGSCLLNPVESTQSLNPETILTSCASGSSLTYDGTTPLKQVPSELSILENLTKWGPPRKDISSLGASDESVKGSNPSSPENPILQDPSSLGSDNPVHSSSTSSFEEQSQMHNQTARRSIRLPNFTGDNLQRMVIPIGPLFQADIPVWTGSVKKVNLTCNYAESESSRFLGTLIWPIKRGRSAETAERVVGKGRANSCSCVSPGSTKCIKHHIHEERLLLQSDLGPAFLSWKFDEMGEEVSKSWTQKDQQSFTLLVRTYSPSNGKNLMKHALKCFRSKCKESVVSYYFNVFIPRRISMQIRSSLREIDSDDDEADDRNHTEISGRCKGRSTMKGSLKDYKTRYLIRRS